VVFTRHSAFPLSPKFTRAPGRGVFKRITEHYADRIICVSPVCRDYLLEGGIREELMDVVLNGVDKVIRRPEAEGRALRASLGIGDEFTAAIIARIEPYKGQDIVVEAARILKSRGCMFKIILAGTGTDEERIRGLISERDVGDTVILPGFVEDVPGLLSAIDVQINASDNEATSLSLLEGMSMGLPAVVSDFPGNLVVVQDGDTGLVFKMRDPVGLADALQRLIDDRALLAAMGRRAEQVYEQRFTGMIFAKNTEAVYTRMAGGRTG
jgi:glycosyltransferase involved in cell wall biosynthesis